MDKFLKTIAFQVSDPDFFEEYEKRQKESGLKVKDYFFGLIRADIAQNQKQADSPAQDEGIETVASEPEQTADTPEQQAEESAVPADLPEQTEESEEQQSQPAAPDPNEEMMNLFVKIPRDQRVALECHKNETVGNVLNRLIDNFLKHTREGDLPEGFEKAYEKYESGLNPCDTKASAKIPSKTNDELTDFINSHYKSRNVVIAALVDLELNRQEMSETQDQDQGMGMSM